LACELIDMSPKIIVTLPQSIDPTIETIDLSLEAKDWLHESKA